jgi:hypothetical protein
MKLTRQQGREAAYTSRPTAAASAELTEGGKYSFPLVGEGWDGGEKPGISAVLILTPTPPSPVEGEGTTQRLTAPLVPNSIGEGGDGGGRNWVGGR